ncbi:MAG TPA: MlaD family protein [Candidatus Omnitrophota bacterium]|nr:MlaD family protein [Candidatus Omnitrophota bacterium]
MKIRMTNEAKTGVLVVACAVALTLVILKVGNFKLLQEGYLVKAQFHYTAGVKQHAPVRLSGVDVGEVKAINVLYGEDTVIELDIWLEEGVKIRKDALAYVTTLGLMGEKYIEIRAGSSAAEYAAPGDLIPSEEPVRLEDLLKMATEIGDDVSKMAQDISKVANTVNETVEDNKPKIGRIFDNLEDTSENFNDFSQDIKFHPWKILAKGKEKSKDEMDAVVAKERAKRLRERAAQLEKTAGISTATVPVAVQTQTMGTQATVATSNFAKRK